MRPFLVHITFGFILLLCNTKTTHSQQLGIVSSSHYNLFNENVAFAGNYNATHFTTDYHKISSVNGAPTQYSFSLHTPLKQDKIGAGIQLNQIQIGAHEESTAKLALSYKLGLRNGLLNFGLGTGISIYNFDVNALTPLATEDILLSQTRLKNHFIDVSFGVMYTADKTYAGVELSQITQSSWNLHESDNSSQVVHFKLTAGQVFTLKNTDLIRVSAHARSDVNIQPQLDLMVNYFYNKFIWIGIGYRTNYGLLANLEVNISKRLQFGYSYASVLGSQPNVISSKHQLFIGYMLPSSNKKAPKIRKF